ncbi:CD276 antigen homolog isoform X5 [Tachysurus vachellii]|uniref:CD276 antigen homolog isoform X5 n=1 Tax=Tachysurus vachellii TaxID=175792 RepID=UPI00296ACF59|nr:CD276 antigen homolog isoform X5 [Tachysurus vachellii]
MLVLIVLVSSTSSFSSASTRELRMCSTGFTNEMVTYTSPDRASVNSIKGERALLTASKTSMSAHDGTRRLDFFVFRKDLCNSFPLFEDSCNHHLHRSPSEVHVICIYSEDCILPCLFPPSSEEVFFQWYKQGTLIYSFLEDEDESVYSSISVFTDEVSHGNASLLLHVSNIKSRGRYKCVVNTTKSVQESYIIVKVEEMSVNYGEKLVIPCMAPKNLKNLTLTWTFISQNKRTDVLTYFSQTQRIKNHWDDRAELDLNKALMGDGSLYLNNLGSKHSGTYTCTYTGSQVKHIVQTLVSQTGNSGSKLWMVAITVAITVAALILLCVIFYIYRKYKGKSKDSWQDHNQQDAEMQTMHEGNSVEELQAEIKPLANHKKGESSAGKSLQ